MQARYLVEAMNGGDDESMLVELARLTANRASGGRESHLVVTELISALAEMMLTAGGATAQEDRDYGLELTNDEDDAIAIDETSPPVRATVRALLAELNERTDDALFQVDLALREDTLLATLEVFAHILLWTIGMLKWCDANDVARPQWLGAMAFARRAHGDG